MMSRASHVWGLSVSGIGCSIWRAGEPRDIHIRMSASFLIGQAIESGTPRDYRQYSPQR